jgi:hypothetical protein
VLFIKTEQMNNLVDNLSVQYDPQIFPSPILYTPRSRKVLSCEVTYVQQFLFERLVNGISGEFAGIGSINPEYHLNGKITYFLYFEVENL